MANPETCLHNVVAQMITGTMREPVITIICVTCNSTIDPDFADTKNYHYDIDYNVWVHKNPFRDGTECPLCPPQKGCNHPMRRERE